MCGKTVMELEEKGCFDFFWHEVSLREETFGLIRDNTVQKDMASIASIGFGLAAITIGVNRGYISREEGEERAYLTLRTMNEKIESIHGFYHHFLHMSTGKQYGKCEVSIIDTAIFLMGALCAAQYFKGKVNRLFDLLFSKVDWDWYRNKETNQFYMGYSAEGRFFGAWDQYAEQFMVYVLACGSPTHSLSADIFYECPLQKGDYKQIKGIYHNHSGSLFVYQFSHAFIDFSGKKDERGIDWFENSVKASHANRQYCMDNEVRFRTYHKNSWGLTACDTPHGYSGAQGGLPSYNNNCNEADGTVPPCGAIGSIVFTPEESLQAMEYYFTEVEKLWGKYGFMDAYNLDVSPQWYSDRVIGIDKGISIVMIENYSTGLIWDLAMDNPYIKKGMETLGIA